MFLKFKDSEEEICIIQYDEEENMFFLQDKENKIVCECCSKLKLDPKYDPSQYEYLFCIMKERNTQKIVFIKCM